jgi:hypothetical protein
MTPSPPILGLLEEPRGCVGPRRIAIWLAVACVLVAGCGRGSKFRRLPLAGSVTFAGQPVDDGLIEFIPVDATPGPSFGGVVKAGRYAVPAAQGGYEGGTYRVQITASRASGKTFTVNTQVFTPDGTKMEVPVMENFIPTKYNVASTLRVTLNPEASAAGIDFALE